MIFAVISLSVSHTLSGPVMKKLLLFIPLLLTFCYVHATTHITTPTVSGHWTVAGSPYVIHNNATVASTDVLTIDPGVEVAFNGYHKLSVLGMLNAAGTAAQPIVFRAVDTTGWSGADTVGGWQGLELGIYWGTSTLSPVISHCRFQDMRSVGVDAWFRNTDLHDCEFVHNKGRVIQCGFADTTYRLGLYNCNIHDNVSDTRMLLLTQGYVVVHGCNVHHNTTAGSTFFIQFCKVFIDSSEIHDNLQTATSLETTINLLNVTGVVRANRIHHNTSQYDGALAAMVARLEISDNYICNNNTTTGFTGSSACGSVEGGGGVRISGEGGADPSYFLVRNNVIANNYAALAGGAIYVMLTNAEISNNTMVNNKGMWGGAIYIFNDVSAHPHTRVNVKNNLFKHNVTTSSGTSGLPDTLVAMWITTGDTLLFERNVSEHHFADNYFLGGGATLTPVGDTGSNLATTNPGLIAPTLTANWLEDATTANFSLLMTSPAINRGNITEITPEANDHAGNTRIQGAAIDAGAFEYGPFCPDTIAGPHLLCLGMPTLYTHPVSGGTWSSYDAPGTVTMGSTGSVTAVGPGTAVINYIVGGCLASTILQVDTLPDAGTLSGSTVICNGSSFPLFPSVAGGTWSSSSGASVSSAGLVTGLTVGSAIITYTMTNFCGSDAVTRDITVNPLPSPIHGDTIACISMGGTMAYNDTAGGIWSSSDTTVVSIDAMGHMTGYDTGSVVITYTLPTGCYTTRTITTKWCPDAVRGVAGTGALHIYPNPARNELAIESAVVMQHISVYDLQGRCLYSGNPGSKTTRLDLSRYNAGMYFVRVDDRPLVRVVKE